ncbi:hypothetical protein ONS95_012600 [Cadophora gregata]|uniref:uncharacterized protein n=1 Tax=Cadophora gregata TaxID=51156 RepID=UPI0026DB66D9|nr:uncharacterized protein ONS95_012600 [Cadophora gregata]KAK0118306.1 hypothetical protein ONS95_012600 [Cadophora gregata]KAK0123373.1 hypothetical protein ONS96_010365 [Cadophora gregata f. sp. sojae]
MGTTPSDQNSSEVAMCDSQDKTGKIVPYTAFSVSYRWYLTYLLGFLCLASSLTANIYFPLINLLAENYDTSIQGINLTITLYIVVQGISPSIFSPLSDQWGRRPVYLLSSAIYAIGSLGLAFSGHSYVALLLLRALQSMGGSATLSLAYAVVADFAPHSQRGRFLSPMMTATNIGPCIGPVIGGGAILATGNVRWAFWTLVIFGFTSLALIGFTMRETNRNVVGNGEIAAHGVWRAWFDTWNLKRRSNNRNHEEGSRKSNLNHSSYAHDEKHGDSPVLNGPVSGNEACNNNEEAGNFNNGKTGKGVFKFPNPFASLRLLLMKDALTVLCLAASPYASWYTITTSIPLIYGSEYGFNDLLVGCCYLTGGAGIILGGFVAGRMMDWNYKYTARKVGIEIDEVVGDDLQNFPIEHARSRGFYTIISASTLVFVGFGWAVQYHVHPAVPLLLQFYLGAKCTVTHQTYSALLVDIFPANAGAAGASNNICRCALSALAVAVPQPLVQNIGRSWYFTLVGLLDGVGSLVGIYVLRRWGATWRAERQNL